MLPIQRPALASIAKGSSFVRHVRGQILSTLGYNISKYSSSLVAFPSLVLEAAIFIKYVFTCQVDGITVIIEDGNKREFYS